MLGYQIRMLRDYKWSHKPSCCCTLLLKIYCPRFTSATPWRYRSYPSVVQSPYGIGIDQTSHIQETVHSQCLPDASERVNSSPTPFKADTKFELALAETLPDTPAELHHLEERYLGKFSAYISQQNRSNDGLLIIGPYLSSYPKCISAF